jgi:two-component system cell cycle sensor histidine kinase PleC
MVRVATVELPMKPQIVVIIDDRITNLKILERLAGSLGDDVVVRTFADPRGALAFMRETPADLIITDFKVPDLDGAEFIRQFKRQDNAADVPVIVITAYEDNDLRYRALEAGASDYLLSPVDHNEFKARSRNLLTLRRQQLLLKERASSLEAEIALEQRRHQDALRESHDRLLRVIDAIPVMISATAGEGRYVFVNNCYAAAIGATPKAMMGRTPVEVRATDHARRIMELDRRLLAGAAEPASFEEEFVAHDGTPSTLLTTKTLLRDPAGAATTVVTIAIDITQRKGAELALVTAKDVAEIANRSKTEFLANMSHELRTPLNAIIGFSQVMASEMLGPLGTKKYIGYARDISNSAEHLLGIINDILDVSKLEAGKLDLADETVDVAKAVRDLMHLVEERARSTEVMIDTDMQPELPQLRADGRKLKQILLNLITNAVKFSKPGGVVTVRGSCAEGRIVLAVADHGIGMDEGEIQTAITRFGQVASTWARKHAGTGLGLPLAMGLIELHGGSLAIESRKGIGTTVTVTFPPDRTMSSALTLSPA